MRNIASMSCPKFLRVATQPVFMLAEAASDESDGFYAEIELTKIFSQKLGFTYVTNSPSDKQWGSRLDNGSWSGMVGMLQNDEADVIISALSITEERAEVIDFSFPYMIDRIGFVTRNLELSESKVFFLKPFSSKVWIYVCLTLLTLPAIYSILFRRMHSLDHFKKGYRSFLLTSAHSPRSAPEKLLRVCWLLFQNLLRWSYAAVLLSFMTFPSSAGVRTIPELAHAIQLGTYYCAAYAGTFYTDAMLSSLDPNVRVIGQSLRDNENYDGLETVLANTKLSKKPAYISKQSIMDGMYNMLYFMSDDAIFSDYIAVGIRKGLRCKEKIDSVIHDIWSAGIYTKLLRDYTSTKMRKILYKSPAISQGYPMRRLSLSDFQGIFTLLLAGHCVAMATFIIELALGRR